MSDDNQGGKVIFLKFRSENQIADGITFLACAHCRNKTYRHVIDDENKFPIVQCAACGNHIGRIGWAHDDDPLVKNG